MKLTDFSIEELRDICNHAGWSCRELDGGKYKTKASIVAFLKENGVTDPPGNGKKLWSVTFEEWVNEVLGLDEYERRMIIRDEEGNTLDVPENFLKHA